MSNAAVRPDKEIRYEPNERPPPALSFGLGLQQGVLSIGGIVLTPVIVIRAAGENDLYMSWAVKAAELELVAAPGEENLEDRMVLLTERGGIPAEHEISLRLLRHYASSVYHQQYHDTDIVTVRVEGDGQE